MKKYSMREVEEAVGGTLVSGDGEAIVSSVSQDSRGVDPGELFFAIPGDNHDGHDFLPQAMERGCRDFVVSSREWASKLENAAQDVRTILVEDTVNALGKLAADYREKMNITVIGITGSTGKTGTKDLTRCVCEASFKTGYTEGNYNNHIGLPLSILNFPESTEVGVLEMGMDKPGEIRYLAEIARPHIGLMTNIGVSHIENIGSREGIFRCKMEIADYFEEDDLLIVSEGEDFLRKRELQSSAKGRYKVQICGRGEDCDFVLSNIEAQGAQGVKFDLEHRGEKQEFYLPVLGIHNAYNASLAVAAGVVLGIPMRTAADALAGAVLTGGRLDVKEAGDVRILDDTYNASPDSMRTGIDVLTSMEGGRKVAVLGDMFELGEDTRRLHREVGSYAREKGVDRLYGVGKLAENIFDGFGGDGGYCKEKKDFLQIIEDEIQQGDVVLVKGSRGMVMEEIVRGIISKRSK